MILDDKDFITEANKIVEYAKDFKIRLLGSIACKIHCPNHSYLLEEMKRKLTDIDFVAYSYEKDKVISCFENLGYKSDEHIRMMTEGGRYFFKNPHNDLGIDIFFDKLDFCHPIYFRNRLEKDSPTITVSDILLGKMQIVQINEKDIKDLVVLLLEHDIDFEDHNEIIDLNYICKLMSNDWGFYYTFNLNIDRMEKYIRNCALPMSEDQKEAISYKLIQLKKSIEQSPKSVKWKLRSKIGTKVIWYQEVGEKDSQLCDIEED